MNYQVIKVASGFMVRPPVYNNPLNNDQDIYVFRTWTECSRWLNEKFKGTGNQL